MGNGTSKKKIADESGRGERDASTLFLSARLPIRTTASSTIASTAALRPKNSATITGTLP